MKRILLFMLPAVIMLAGACSKTTTKTPTPAPAPVYLASSTPTTKSVVIEDFTGVRCGYCPTGHDIAQTFSDNNPGKVILISTHSGPYATYEAGWPDYTTSFGAAINAQSGIAGYPAGAINRRVFTTPCQQQAGGMANTLTSNTWYSAGTTVLGETSPVNIGLKSTFDASSRTLTVTAETYYTADETVANNLNVGLLEDNVVGIQEDYRTPSPYIVYKYNQMDMLRTYMTGQWGETLTTTKTGNRTTKTYTYVVPGAYNIDNCRVVAFVTEGHVNILTGAQTIANGK